jgi:glycosyltransferase involved in cell wall biosynthesis
MTIRLSIIIPVYNNKKYLKECLNSICQQVRQDVEIILINDCSTDGSIKICKRFAKKYNFIRLINQKVNGGVAHCRNIGIKTATGKYICFVDSDDKLSEGSIDNVLYHIRVFYGKEIFVLRYIDSRNEKISDLNIDKNYIFHLKTNKENKSLVNYIKNFDKFRTRCWHFIVNKKFLRLNNIYFKNIRIQEDVTFVSEIACLAKSFKIIEKPTHIYERFVPNTLSASAGYIVVISHIKIIHEIGLFINKKKKILNKLEIKFLFTMLKKSIESIFSDIVICELNEIKKASKYLYKYNSILLKLSNFGFKKLGFLLQSDKIINESLLKYKSKKFKALKKKFGKLRYNNIILFCAGKTSIMATKILTNMGAKITIIIDNNNKFYGKKLDNIIIKNPSYLEKNLGKFSNHKILICIKNIDPANIIKLQLNKIGIKNKNIYHFNM